MAARVHPEADASSDLLSGFPKELLEAWAASGRTPADHERILQPYRVEGTFVCSDAAGLTKLSKSRPLLEVLKLVSEPKETVFKWGSAIGGVPIGIWVADNTEMFYPASVPVPTVVAQMLAAQRELGGLTVKIGIGVGCTAGAPAYLIGRGLYGKVVDELEGRAPPGGMG